LAVKKKTNRAKGNRLALRPHRREKFRFSGDSLFVDKPRATMFARNFQTFPSGLGVAVGE